MTNEFKTTNLSGPPPATGIFKPRFMQVEESIDVDEVFRRARQLASGERSESVEGETPNMDMVEGQRAVAIVTPGRLIMCDPCPEPNSVPEKHVAEISSMLPPDPPLTISVISYTNIEALTEDKDMTRTIPFRGILNGWAYIGHNVMVFEGHPAALESGVRDSDVLLVDSGMLPFIQLALPQKSVNEGISRAKAQRRKEKPFKNAAALCVFAPLREIKTLLGQSLYSSTGQKSPAG